MSLESHFFKKKTLNWSLISILKQVIVIRLFRWLGYATDTNAFLDSCWQTLINSDLCQTFEAKLTVSRYPSAKVDAIENSHEKFLVFGSKNNKAQAAGLYHWFQQKKKDELNEELWKGTTKGKNQIACFDEKDLDRKKFHSPIMVGEAPAVHKELWKQEHMFHRSSLRVQFKSSLVLSGSSKCQMFGVAIFA